MIRLPLDCLSEVICSNESPVSSCTHTNKPFSASKWLTRSRRSVSSRQSNDGFSRLYHTDVKCLYRRGPPWKIKMHVSKCMSVQKKHILQRALSLMGDKYMQHTIKDESLCSPQSCCLDLLGKTAQNGTYFVILCNIFQDLFAFHFNNTWSLWA